MQKLVRLRAKQPRLCALATETLEKQNTISTLGRIHAIWENKRGYLGYERDYVGYERGFVWSRYDSKSSKHARKESGSALIHCLRGARGFSVFARRAPRGVGE